MSLAPDFLRILRCPKTLKPLRLASSAELSALNARVAERKLANAAGRVLEASLAAGLVPEGEPIVYPVDDDIPILLIDEAIPLPTGAR